MDNKMHQLHLAVAEEATYSQRLSYSQLGNPRCKRHASDLPLAKA